MLQAQESDDCDSTEELRLSTKHVCDFQEVTWPLWPCGQQERGPCYLSRSGIFLVETWGEKKGVPT